MTNRYYRPDYDPFSYNSINTPWEDLYANQPMCEVALKQQFNFAFVCKPDSHRHLYDWVAGLDQVSEGLPTLTQHQWNGRFYEV